MSDLKIGSLISDTQQRDAIHIAVAPVIAGELLRSGERIGFTGDDGTTVGEVDQPIGIVDPFLPEGTRIRKGQSFWMFMYPNTITSLRHDWAHPAFAPETQPETAHYAPPAIVGISQRWMNKYADSIGVEASGLLSAAKSYIEDGEYWNEGEKFLDAYLPDEFWIHYQNITGEDVRPSQRGSFFSCSC